MVTVSFSKKDFVWMVPLILVLVVGFVLAVDPNIHGHPDAVVPAGAVVAFNLVECPTGWNPANGASGRPDLRGRFIRGMESFENGANCENNDPNRLCDVGQLRTYQPDEFESHKHTYNGANPQVYVMTGTEHKPGKDGGAERSSFAMDSTGGSETRPKNVALIYCVKI